MIELFRKRHNLTQKKLAEMIGYGDEQVSRWENGAEVPAVVQLALEALERRFRHESKAKWMINLFRDKAGNPHVGDGEPYTKYEDSVRDASHWPGEYHCTVFFTDRGAYIGSHDIADIEAEHCERTSLSGGGECVCGHHWYNNLDYDIGQGGWQS